MFSSPNFNLKFGKMFPFQEIFMILKICSQIQNIHMFDVFKFENMRDCPNCSEFVKMFTFKNK